MRSLKFSLSSGFEQIVRFLLEQLRPTIERPGRQARLALGAAPGHAIDAAILAVAPQFACAAGIGSPIANVHRPVRANDHLAWPK